MAYTLVLPTVHKTPYQKRRETEFRYLANFGLKSMPDGCSWVFKQRLDGGMQFEGIGRVENLDDFGRSLVVMTWDKGVLEDCYSVAVSGVKLLLDGTDPKMPGRYYVIK